MSTSDWRAPVKRISGLWRQRYDLGSGHPLAGATMPALRLADGT
ncbi:hypothetical protein ACFWY9_15995 [Amycolatopsis sp. NPDC059027]